MTGEGQATLIDHPIAAHLKQVGITKALIIDDAYDSPSLDAHLDAIPIFWDRVSRDQGILEELQGLKSGITDSSEIDDSLLALLWVQRETLPKLKPSLQQELFIEKLGDLATLQPLCDHLLELGIESVCVGSEEQIPDEPFGLVFIDYILGPGAASDAAHSAAERAMDIYKKVPANKDKPFIVLMSSKPDAETAKEIFRDRSELLGGLFGYVPKEDLRDKEKLYFHLATWAIGMPTRHDIQHFVEALSTAVKSASDNFIRRVRALGFEDYVNIQWLSLQADGHPLGNYMLWLYKSLLAYLLHDDQSVLAQQQKLDALAFEEFMPSQGPPSPQIAEIYQYALTEPGIGEVAPHPRAKEGSTEPLLCLGDLFFQKLSNDVLMVINAACDLAYSPGTKRKFPKDRSILLLHGILQRYEEIDSSGSIRTELFKHDGKAYRIRWDHRRVTSKAYGKVKDWLSREGYSRKARLALPYALQVQQEFATNLMRIGMPTMPPLFRHADVEVYCESDDGNCMLVGEPIRDGALIIRSRVEGRDEDWFALTFSCVEKIIGSLTPVITRQKECLAAEMSNSQTRKRIEGKLAKLEQLKSLSQEWVHIVRLIPLPATQKKKEVDAKLLWVYHDRSFEGKYKEGPPIVLNIRSERVPEGAPSVPKATETPAEETSND